MKHIVALSGGKDSTAMALHLAEVEPRDYVYVCTPTGDESDDMLEHWEYLEKLLGAPLVRLVTTEKDGRTRTLDTLIEDFNALPNNRQRWCTRMLKIEPMKDFIKANAPAVQYVGLRADEEERKGIYSEEIQSDFPLRRWNWGLAEVVEYLRKRGIKIPVRTDCLKCYDQRLHEWRAYLQNYPFRWMIGEAQEEKTGATFRSPSRDTWPASLKELRERFTKGWALRGDRKRNQLQLVAADAETEQTACRVCKL